MKRLVPGGLLLIMAAAMLTAGGCVNEKDEQIAALQLQYNDLSNQNKDLRTQLAQTKTREAELLAQVDGKDLQLAGKNEELDGLKVKLAAKPKPTVSDGDWDVGRYADKISVGSDILFASGRATLTAGGKKALGAIVRDLNARYRGLPVRVYGYTDSDPIRRTKKLWKDNLDLSANRSMAVTRYFVSKGIKAESIETVAMGATHFVARNDTRANKAKNRRVEIVVIKQ